MQTKPSYNVFRTIKHQKGSVVILKHSKFRIGPKFMHRSNKFQSYPLRLCAKQTNKQKNCTNKCAFLPRGFFMHNHAKITQCILEWNLFYQASMEVCMFLFHWECEIITEQTFTRTDLKNETLFISIDVSIQPHSRKYYSFVALRAAKINR